MNRTHPHRARRRGNATTIGLSLMALLGCTALVVDVGFLYSARTDMQAALDAAALAGVGYFDLTPEGVQTAKEKAVEFALLNEIVGEAVTLPISAIEVGFIDENGAFVVSQDPEEISAMRIDHTKIDVPTFFAGVAFSKTTMSMRASSVARRFPSRGAGRVSCFLPLAVPDCMFTNGAQFQNVELRLNSANQDNAGWADPDGNPNTPIINEGLLGQCDRGDAWVTDDVYLNNGTITAALQTVASILNNQTAADTSAWDTAAWGAIPPRMASSSVSANNYGKYTLQGPIVLFKSEPGETCGANTQFNQTKEITGFTWAIVYDVKQNGNDKNIRVRLDMTKEYDVGSTGGGLDTNILAPGGGSLIQ